MLQAIKELGIHEIKNSGSDGSVKNLIETPKLKNTKKILCIAFKDKNNGLVYERTTIEDFNPDKPEKILFHSTKGAQYNVTPASIITQVTKKVDEKKELDVDETVKKSLKRLKLWFKTHKDVEDLFKIIGNEIDANENSIKKSLIENYRELRVYKKERIDEKRGALITIKVGDKHLGDLEPFKKIFLDTIEKEFSYRKSFGEVYIKGNGICYVCREQKEVLGLLPIFSFYSMDKRGFAPEFKREEAWKRLPICKECSKTLKIGKGFLDKYLQKTFYHGFRFYVIPIFSFEFEESLINELKHHKTTTEYASGLLCIEDRDLQEVLFTKKDNSLSFIFLFFRPKQAGIEISRYVEGVSPSWLKKLDGNLKDMKKFSLYQEENVKRLLGKKQNGNLDKIDAKSATIGGLVEPFFPSSKEKGIYDKYFIDIVGDVLAGRKISEHLLINAFMREIKNRHVNDKNWEEKLLSIKSLLLYLYLSRLNLLKINIHKIEYGSLLIGDIMTNDRVVKVRDFFKEYEQAFNSPDKRAIFLEGVLAKFLLDKQYATRHATPFQSKLHGLQMDVKKVKGLLPVIKNKLWEYDAGYPWLENLISRYFIEAEKNGWNLTKDEVSYYFALGLNLGGIFKGKNTI